MQMPIIGFGDFKLILIRCHEVCLTPSFFITEFNTLIYASAACINSRLIRLPCSLYNKQVSIQDDHVQYYKIC